jgi:hypothetical protein
VLVLDLPQRQYPDLSATPGSIAERKNAEVKSPANTVRDPLLEECSNDFAAVHLRPHAYSPVSDRQIHLS